MTQDEIIEMARQAGAVYSNDHAVSLLDDEIIIFAQLVAQHEREACAKLADEQLMNTSALMSMPPKSSAAWDIANAIRARGQA
jgi:hypothetical protein